MADELEITVAAEVTSLKEVRKTFAPILEEWEPESADMLLLALVECCSNVVRHRRASLGEGCIRIHAERQPDVLRFRIDQFCTPEDVPSIKPRKFDSAQPGGHGTLLVDRIMTRVIYEPDVNCPDSVTLVLEKSLPDGSRDSTDV